MSTIQELNDSFRTSGFIGGELIITCGVDALPPAEKMLLVKKVMNFDEFTKDNDPYREHDFGSIQQGNVLYFWKIDYYNRDMTGGSEDPSDPRKTTRVLTLMEASEY